MKEITVSEALQLVRSKAAPAISLYLGTNVAERDSAVRIKSSLQRLYRTAEALIGRTYDVKTRERLLQPLKKALGALRLNRSKGGVAIYHSENFTGIVHLPTPVSDLAVAADSFHLKPVLRCAQLRRNYYILAFRKKYADLLMATADGTRLVERIELFSRSVSNEAGIEGSARLVRDGLRIRRQKDLKASMTILNRQLETYWHGERMPLVLAGSHHNVEAFKVGCSYANVLERSVVGYVEDLDFKALTSVSEGVMQQHFAAVDAMAIVAFRKAEASGLASTDLTLIGEAVARGQVQSLLIAEDRHVWGHLNRSTGAVEVLGQRENAKADDLLDDLGELALLKGGHVTVLPSIEMPDGATIAAVLRWNEHRKPLVYQRPWAPPGRPHGRERHIETSA